MSRSRLSHRMEAQSKKRFFLYTAGSVLILFFVLRFGINLLANLALLMGSKDASDTSFQNSSVTFVAPPILNPLPQATNSAVMKISGTSTVKGAISLYINNQVVDKTQTQDDKSFSFDSVTLTKGDNAIQVKVTDEKSNKESDFSNQVTISYKTDKPKLTVDSPSDNQSFSKDSNTAPVSGTTDPGDKVTVNGLWAIVSDDGKFSYTIPLQNGNNKLKIIAADDAGNTTEIDKTVTYSQ